MPFTLPPKSDALRRTIARSHNRRIAVWFAIMVPFLAAGVFATKSNISSWLLTGTCILTLLVFTLGAVYWNRRDKQQAVKLGFVCPLCGEGLYCLHLDRLWIRGECPHCKRAIIEKIP